MREQDSPAPPASSLVPVTRLAVLVFTDIVGSTRLKSDLGDTAYMRLLNRHNELFESGIRDFSEARIIKHTGDGYFAEFRTPSDAVRFALLFQRRMALEPWHPATLRARLGIHQGEISTQVQAGQEDIVGTAADVATRIMSLAVPGQILLTQQAFNDARQYVREPPPAATNAAPLRWLSHGRYLFKGVDEPLEICEVGIEGLSPLAPPPNNEKAVLEQNSSAQIDAGRDARAASFVADYANPDLHRRFDKALAVLRVSLEVLFVVISLALLVPLYTGIRIRWYPLMQPVTFFNAMDPLFGWFWNTYFVAMLALAVPILMAPKRWFRTRLPFMAAYLLALAVGASVGYRWLANPVISRVTVLGSTGMVHYDEDNRLLVGSGNGQIGAYDPMNLSFTGPVVGGFRGAENIRTSRDGRRLLVTRTDNLLELLDPKASRSIAAIRNPIPTQAGMSGAFSPDGSKVAMVVSSEYDETSKKWVREGQSSLWIVSAEDGSILSKEPTPYLRGVRQPIDWVGNLIAAADCHNDSGRGVMLYDIAEHRVRFNLVHPGLQFSPLSVKLSPDGAIAAVGYAPHDVALWDTATGKLLRHLQSRNNWVVCLDFSPDGKLLASGEGNSAGP